VLAEAQVATPTKPEDAIEIEEEQVVEDGEHLFVIDKQGQRRRLPKSVRFDTNQTTRPGWIDDPSKKTQPTKIICHCCYAYGHIAPQCQSRLYNLRQTLENYEKLTEEEKKTVPDTSYESAKAYLEICAKKTGKPDAKDPKN